ncbi:MAG: hypothetical protein MUF13_03140 [Akkermansiaceae bacterium]|nr:hypothetical protein [Akkermansiaceae bacterium]
MKSIFALLVALHLMFPSLVEAAVPAPDGIWQLNDNPSNDRLNSTALTLQNFTAQYADDTVTGHMARVLQVPLLTTPNKAVILPTTSTLSNGTGGNGGGVYLNNYSLVMDVKLDSLPSSAALFQTDTSNNNDADIFLDGSGNFIFSGVGNALTPGVQVSAGTWARIAITCGNSFLGGPLTVRAYINGVKVFENTAQSFDGRFSLDPTVLLFADNNSEVGALSCNTIGFWRSRLSDANVAALGGPSAGGLTTLLVENTNASGPQSLSAALTTAAANSGADSIGFAAHLNGQNLTLPGEIFINDASAVTIDATGLPAGFVLDGGAINRHFVVLSLRSLTLRGLTLARGKSLPSSGGSILNQGTLRLFGCRFVGNLTNEPGGAVYSETTLVAADCSFVDGISLKQGGAIYVAGGTANLSNCTFSGNWAADGGAFYQQGGAALLTQCTFAGNLSSNPASTGAVKVVGGDLGLRHCTISKNAGRGQAGGLCVRNPGTLDVDSCIVAGNTDLGGGPADILKFDNLAGFTVAGTNLIGSNQSVTTEFPGPTARVGTSSAPVDPRLTPLGHFGGRVQTMHPLVGSPAIDAAGVAAPTASDARRFSRLADGDASGGAQLDIGAVEAGPIFTVTSTVDGNSGAIRNGISASSAPGTRIVFSSAFNNSGLPSTLLNGELAIPAGRAFFIDASNIAGGVTISGNNAFRVFNIPASANLAMHSLKLIDGQTGSDGGGIRNLGTCTVLSSTLSGNISFFSSGGGIYNQFGGTCTVVNSTLSGNIALDGGGIFNTGNCTVVSSTLSGNNGNFGGGGILNRAEGTCTVLTSTFTGNFASVGGGIENHGTCAVRSSTLTGNSANQFPHQGGGIYNASRLDLIDSIVTWNDASNGADIFTAGTGTMTGTGNLIGDAPLLSPLGEYGGPTRTLALQQYSPARNVAQPFFRTHITDQRGLPFFGVADIGAYERQLGSIPDAIIKGNTTTAPIPFTVGQVGTLTASSSNPTLIPNSNLVLGGSGANRSITLTPATNRFGTAVITITDSFSNETTQFTLTVDLFVVTTLADSGPGSLREAISNATGLPGPDLIVFSNGINGGTISLASPLVVDDATGSVTIDASSLPGGLTVDGNNTTRHFIVAENRSLTLRGLTLTRGRTPSSGPGGGSVQTAGTFLAANCTFVDNTSLANGGGAISNSSAGVMTLQNCTFTGNTASYGGAIVTRNTSQSTLIHCTFTGNQAIGTDSLRDGGGAINLFQGSMTLTSCILAGNTAATGTGPDFWRESTVAGTSATTCLIGDGKDSTFAHGVNGNLVGTSALPIDAKLSPLGYYGGPTPTLPPLPGSPAVDASGATSSLTTDQRGFPRSRDGNGDGTSLPDIGAVEASLVGVSVPGDNVAGSLRAALAEAAAQPGADTVYFTSAITGHITLAGEILITDPTGLTLDASDRPTGIVIDGGPGTNRHFRIAAGTTAVFKRLRLYGGNGGGAEVDDIGHGGSIRNEGNLTLRECMIADCTSPSFGGALFNTGNGTLILERCTLHGNSATSGGGAIQQVSPNPLTLTACTVANNRGGFEAGGINAPFGPASLIHSTVSGNAVLNPGNGVGGLRGGALTVRDSIIAGNTDAGFPGIPNISPGFSNQGTNLTSGDPKLAALGDYGGPSWTMPPMPGSPAIEAATTSTAAIDQRGVDRPLDSDDSGASIREIGAVEVPDPWIVGTPADELDFTGGDGTGYSLREALRDAPAAATILFSSDFNGEPADTITLSPALGEITLTKGVIISASANPGGVSIDGGPGTNRIFSLPPGTGASLHHLTLSGGNAGGSIGNGSGGAILSQEATLALTDCTVIGNIAPSGGGAVHNLSGTLELNRCLLAFNSGSEGGAVQSSTAPVTGPATSTATFTNCTFTANTATLRGGGLFNANGHTTLLHCTIVGNAAPSGEGSGVASSGFDTARTTVQNSLIAKNSNTSEVSFVQNPINTFHSRGGNLIGSGNATPVFNQLRDATAQTEASLRLGPLEDYGGPSLTVALRPGSPALSNATASPVITDQRGFGIVGGAKDSGAYEAGNFLNENYKVFAQEALPHTATTPQRAATFDFDGDGTSNQLEWLAGTGANNPTSRFRLGLFQDEGDLKISFPTITGRSYRLEQSATLLENSWSDSGLPPKTGNNALQNFIVTPATGPTRLFYRVGVSQP